MLALVPARGGSKGLPGKNLAIFNGLPLVAHTVGTALEANLVDRVFVSTDCDKIQAAALDAGASSLGLRPAHLAADESAAIDVYIHFLDEIERKFGTRLDSILILQPTSPLRLSLDVDRAIELFERTKADSVVAYTESKQPLSWHKKVDGDGKLISIFEESKLNRQHYERTFYPNGAIYIFKTALLRSGHYYSEASYAYVMPWERSIDIDFEADLNLAELLSSSSKSSF